MRRHWSGLVLCCVLATAAHAQAILGTYTTAPAAGRGGAVTLVLKKDAQGAVVGSLSGNGVSYTVRAEMQGEDVRGTFSGDGLRSYFEAHRDGAQLRMIAAEIGADGKPDYAKAREIMLTASAGVASGNPPAGAGGGNANPPAASGTAPPAGTPTRLGLTAQDQQVAALLTSTAWCSFSFSGSGGSSGTTRKSRAVFNPDGTGSEVQNAENAQYGSAGSVVSNGSNAQQARWKIENGRLLLSADGVQWVSQTLKIADNGSGAPIVTANGKEYMRCK